MQSLFDACASKMTHKEYPEIAALPTPKTVTECLLEAKKSRFSFDFFLEKRLGKLANECFVFSQDGGILLVDTLANIVNGDLKQGFRYNCAFGQKKKLAAIWKKLSDEDRAALRADIFVVVQYYSTLVAGEEIPHMLLHRSFRETILLSWDDAALSIYRRGDTWEQKDFLFFAYLSAVMQMERFNRVKICNLLCKMQKGRKFVYDEAEMKRIKDEMILKKCIPDSESVKHCAQMCKLQEFEDLMAELVGVESE